MTRTLVTGHTCVGDLRLAPIDVGFDLRLHDMPVKIPDAFTSVGLEQDGNVWLIQGSRDDMVAAIRAAGYRIMSGDQDRCDLGIRECIADLPAEML